MYSPPRLLSADFFEAALRFTAYAHSTWIPVLFDGTLTYYFIAQVFLRLLESRVSSPIALAMYRKIASYMPSILPIRIPMLSN
jgi:hypothetical protein